MYVQLKDSWIYIISEEFMSFPFREAGLPEMLPWVWLNPPVPLYELYIIRYDI